MKHNFPNFGGMIGVIPSYILTNFLILVAGLFLTLMFGLNKGLEYSRHSNIRGTLILTALGVLGWLLFLSIMAGQGFFRQWHEWPPKIGIVVIVPLILILVLSRMKSFTYLVKEIPESWPVYAQGFRIYMEIILARLFLDEFIPEVMTYEGLNFDILSGIGGILVGYFCFTKKKWPKKIAIAYNILGLLLLTTIVVISTLSTPTAVQVFTEGPDNVFIGYPPYILLPGFIVPMAYFFHMVSLKQLLG